MSSIRHSYLHANMPKGICTTTLLVSIMHTIADPRPSIPFGRLTRGRERSLAYIYSIRSLLRPRDVGSIGNEASSSVNRADAESTPHE